jgi:hypothetical protein
MKTLNEALNEKQSELARVAKEVDALRIVAPLLPDEEDRGHGGTDSYSGFGTHAYPPVRCLGERRAHHTLKNVTIKPARESLSSFLSIANSKVVLVLKL